jgi:hypothetical protein
MHPQTICEAGDAAMSQGQVVPPHHIPKQMAREVNLPWATRCCDVAIHVNPWCGESSLHLLWRCLGLLEQYSVLHLGFRNSMEIHKEWNVMLFGQMHETIQKFVIICDEREERIASCGLLPVVVGWLF